MKSRVRVVVRPALLCLLLVGILSGRLSQGLPFDTLGSIHRVATHPSQHLEGGVHVLSDRPRKQPLANRRRGMTASGDDPFQANVIRLKGSDIASTLSDSGGSVQLCLLLVFCLAVICCASMSISPWYKSDSYSLRKVLAVICTAACYILEGLHSKTPGCLEPPAERAKHAVQPVSSSKVCHVQLERMPRKAAKSRKRKGGHQPVISSPQLPPGVHRAIEKTLSSSSHASAGESGSVLSADTEVDSAVSALRDDQESSLFTPADAQIARLEAEALKQSSQRAARSKKGSRRQGEAEVLDSSLKPGSSPNVDALSQPQTEQISSSNGNGGGRGGDLAKPTASIRTESRQSREGTVLGKQKNLQAASADKKLKDRHGPRMPSAERTNGQLPRVLVISRQQAASKKERPREQQQVVSDDERDIVVAPETPDHGSSSVSTFSSPQSSVFSPSRPYAQVARDNGWQRMGMMSPPPPPPPPPPQRVRALPPSALHAKVFRPATQMSPGSVKGLNAAAQAFSPVPQPVQPSAYNPSAGAPAAQPPPWQHISSISDPLSFNPFPGMSSQRRLVSTSPPPQPASHMGEPLPTTGSSSNTSAAYGGLALPGIFDPIWSTSAAIGGNTSWGGSAAGAGDGWLPAGNLTRSTSPSCEHRTALLASLGEPAPSRQGSW